MALAAFTLGTRTALTVTGLGTLASATYVASADYNCAANNPEDVVVEVEVATTNTPAGNKQVLVFLQESLDGTNFRSGPTSGTSATDEPNLLQAMAISMNSASVTQRASFSVRTVLGYVPREFRIVIKNDLGVALTSGAANTAEVAASIA